MADEKKKAAEKGKEVEGESKKQGNVPPSKTPNHPPLAEAGKGGKERKGRKGAKAETSSEKPFDPYQIIKSALSTEKVIRQIEFDNKLSFVVDKKATKNEVKRAIESLFKVKVTKVNLYNSIRGQKRAYVRLSPAHLASDVSADLGMI